MKNSIKLTAVLFIFAAFGVAPARADAVADFYQGNTVALTVASSAGGGYDTLARAMARFLGKHLPGNSLDEARQREITVGAAGINSTPAFYARLLNEVVGLKLKVIVGYPGQTEAFFAMERGEIDGYSSVFLSTLQATKSDWLPQKKIKAIVYYGPEQRPELAGVPYAPEIVTHEDDRSLLAAAFAPLALGRPFAMPPGVPADRLAAVRKAMSDTFADRDFLAESERLGLGANSPRQGEQIQDVIARGYATPPRVLDRLRKLNTVAR